MKEDDDLIDWLIEQHPGFRKLLERRLRERNVVSADAALRRLAAGAAPKARGVRCGQGGLDR